ncbi:MAG: 50S ribosomal protein L29 [Chloroflexi bacterium]|nr:50S ribosomal protein L29 [Chloroflexota bacterium]
MEAREVRALTDGEIRQRLDGQYETLFNLRFQRVVGQLENTARLGEVRRDIARLKTILRERELAALWEEM